MVHGNDYWQFLALSFAGPVGVGFTLVAAIIAQIGLQLGDVTTITWLVGAWSIASSVSFAIAGSLSDIFGRRYLIISGNGLTIIGGVRSCCVTLSDFALLLTIWRQLQIVGATGKDTTTVIGGMTLLGFGTGLVFVGYAGIAELLPNKWRYVTESTDLLPSSCYY